MITALTAALAAAAAWTAVPGRRDGLTEPTPRRIPARLLEGVAALLAIVVAALVWGPGGAVWAVAAAIVAATVVRVGGEHRRRSLRRTRGRQVAEAARALAGRLSIGDVPAVALASVAREQPVLAAALRAQAVSADVPAALMTAAGVPGQESLAGLARAWRMAQLTGAPLAGATTAVADAMRRRTRLEATLEAELAGPRASGRLMGLLPAAGLLMAHTVGADPADFLLGSWPGRICVLAAVGLSCAGVLWSESIADRVYREVLP
ncbi:type II secretion system F family protein [Acidipropionibacterium acidipropionici]|jgi:tight adherence protein B|uniref:type II secretion system F family protein n=1 Tax=Acidipropionibacterium acidipropionici TaxID=1748 RepID=UPI00110B1BAB|nr:pilus assembly protein TadB [Acidipropionibacterium acidipropionici]QCV94125.1 pilus assembly protein TadB [Acidipropionibacterium acidipropionici]